MLNTKLLVVFVVTIWFAFTLFNLTFLYVAFNSCLALISYFALQAQLRDIMPVCGSFVVNTTDGYIESKSLNLKGQIVKAKKWDSLLLLTLKSENTQTYLLLIDSSMGSKQWKQLCRSTLHERPTLAN